MRPRERSAVAESWKNQFSEEFESLYRKGQKWAEQVCSILILWDSRLDKTFRSPSRWQPYLSKEADQVSFDYPSKSEKRNLFKDLENDLKDSRNPIGVVIVQFIHSYTFELHDEVTDACQSSDSSEAKNLSLRVSDDIKQVTEIVLKACLNFYSCLGKVFKGKMTELRGMILTLIVSGDLYRIIYDLAIKSSKSANDEFFLLKSRIQEENFEIDQKVVETFRDLAVSESPAEKFEKLMSLKQFFTGKDEGLAWYHLIESKVKDLFAHLWIIDLYCVEPMESCFEFFLMSLKDSDASGQSTMI
jgi:hypothetical protein